MSPRKGKPRKPAADGKPLESAALADQALRLRKLSHDLGNSLEAILQAVYLLKRSKVSVDAERWVQLIDSSSQDAARVNRDMRTLLRELDDHH